MHEGVWLKKKFDKMTAVRQLFPYMAFVYALIVPLWADQLLPQLSMKQLETLSIQCLHIEHIFKQLVVMNFIFGEAPLSLLLYTDNPYFFTTFSKFLSLLFC